MATINYNWPRWIYASVNKHFDDRKGTLPLYIEGKHRATTKPKKYLELRMDGPTWIQPSNGYFKGSVQVNTLLTVALDDKDYHDPYRVAGLVQAMYTPTIDVFKFGDGVDDDQSHLGCLVLQQNSEKRDFLELNWFGIIDTDDPLVQATVEGHYRIELCA